jgi:hypothetical protein
VLTAYNPTLLDLQKRMDPDGKIAPIVEMLHETNEILEDMTFMEGNLPTGHKTTIRTGLPAPTWRKLYGGVQPTKSTTAQVTDSCGMLEAYAEVDKALADLSGNPAAFRLSEDRAHLEGMNQEFCDTLFYGNETTEPEAFTGLTPRYNSLTAENAANVIGGGSNDTDNTSIWLVVWGPNTAHGIIPKGSVAGFKQTDLGEVTAGDTTNGYWQAYRTHYRWDVGLTVRDWRYIVRIPNIEISDLTKNAATGADLTDLMAQALEIVPSLKMGRPVFYCNRTIKSWLRRQIVSKVASSTLTMDQVAGKHVLTFDGIPVKRCDAITNTEALVS